MAVLDTARQHRVQRLSSSHKHSQCKWSFGWQLMFVL